MKKRNLFLVVAMFSIFLFGIGAAYAVTGVGDDVPGQDVVIPIICEGSQPNAPAPPFDPIGLPHFGTLTTIWAIAETSGPSCVSDDSVCTPRSPSNSGVGVIRTGVVVLDKNSILRLDTTECWSKYDVVSDSCQNLVNQMAGVDRDAMEVMIGGVSYFVGYVVYGQQANCIQGTSPEEANMLVPWVYLMDTASGFASGFNGVSLENGGGPQLEEMCADGSCDGSFIGVTAAEIYPRYFILNSDPETFNWWILLLGRNAYFPCDPITGYGRYLSCYVCNEAEVCASRNICIPDELNIINVGAGAIPGGLFGITVAGVPIPNFPKAGFAHCFIDEAGLIAGQLTPSVIHGTLSFDGTDSDAYAETYSLFGWAYQRAIPESLGDARLSAVHPIHRLYCDGDDGDAVELPNRFDEGTVAPCTRTGPEIVVSFP
ncbi:MAG: hypothetical protein A2Y97_01785 [Nitrospirae bacterium RBG_13_39_12]|nr:MAG: hypothetical protein A2Y97_01785 [Nitrospirae bacterium RBG_13_39_12]